MKDKDNSIADTEEYKDFESRLNRPLNMLQDNVSIKLTKTTEI